MITGGVTLQTQSRQGAANGPSSSGTGASAATERPATAEISRQERAWSSSASAPGRRDAGAAARRRHHADRQVLHPQQRPDARSPTDPDKLEARHRRRGQRLLELTLGELKSRFQPKTYRMVLECGGGNGRSFFQPEARATRGPTAASAARNGRACRSATCCASGRTEGRPVHRALRHRSATIRQPREAGLSRGVPIAKAMDEMNLIVWAMNGEPLPTSMAASAPDRAGLAGIAQPEMAHPDHDPRPGARRPRA